MASSVTEVGTTESGTARHSDAEIGGFVHLRVRSAYSLLEGALRIPLLVEFAVEDRMPALAVTDTNNLFGALEFAEAATRAGLQPIIGTTLSVDFADDDTAARRGPGSRPGSRVVPSVALLAKDEAGYRNLMALSSAAFVEHDPASPAQIPFERLGGHAGGLVALTGGPGGPVDQCLALDQRDRARQRLDRLADLFGDRLYVELQRHGLPSEIRVEPGLIDLAYDIGLPLVATNDAHFVGEADYEAHDALICIAEGRVVAEDDRRKLTPDHSLKPQAAMVELFSDLPEAIENTTEIARRCAYRPPLRDPILPSFGLGAVGGDVAADEAGELRRQAEDGLRERLAIHGVAPGFAEEDYRTRLAEEVDIIVGMGFPGYFLIVADIIKWSKAHDIPVGPGRGSGAGSLVAWALTITDLDPLKFGLLFERFLNPERVSMPDFDIDFCPERRDEVINYIRDKYGHDRVAQIITFGKLQARAVLRDVGRVLQMPYGQVDRLCKLVPNNPANPVTLAEAIDGEARLAEERDADDTVARLLEISLKLEGLYRHASTHAAGVVIGDRPLVDLIPLYRDPRSEMLVTQFNMKWVELAGLVKFDILGLKTLTVLEMTVRLLRARGTEVDLGTLPLDDVPTYEMLARGETLGVFQFESAGMRDLLFKARPSNFEDLVALVALFRPGPMENIPKYLACKHGEEKPEFLHETIVPVVADTYGVIIYQEQVMQIAQVFAGYSLGEADLLRRAMGKKIKSEMDAQRARFVEGAGANGVDEARATYVFELVDKFAGYGFNKSHSAAYALVAYQTAYLKANHPVEFLAASMTLDLGNTDKLALFREEAKRLQIEIDPPSINAGGPGFTANGGRIAYALAALKNVGRHAVEHIVERRDAGGPFTSLGDFAARIDPALVNRRALESLARSGAFDPLEPNRARVVEGLDQVLQAAARSVSDRSSGQNDLFAGGGRPAAELKLAACEPWDPVERLANEYDAVGFYLSGHPLDAFEATLGRARVQRWRDFETAARDKGHTAGTLAGTVISRRDRRSRSGSRYAFVGFSDPSGQFEAVVFSDVLDGIGDRLDVGKIAIIKVEADIDGERVRLRVQSADSVGSGASGKQFDKLKVLLRDPKPLPGLLSRLESAGDGEVIVVVMDEPTGREIDVSLGRRFDLRPEIERAIKAVPGIDVLQAG